MVRQNSFGFVPEVHEELNVSGCAQHGAGIQLVGAGRRSFDLADQRLAHPSSLVRGTDGKQSDDADTSDGPVAYGTDDLSFCLCYEDMLLSRILFQAFEGFRCPTAERIDAGIFPERRLLHLEKSWKIYLDCRSDVNHDRAPGERTIPDFITEGNKIRKDD